MQKQRVKIAIGVPLYASVTPEFTVDFSRFMYTLGRRYQLFDFQLIWKTKSEQFRARNSIVESALLTGCDFLLFLDDDQVIDCVDSPGHKPYSFLEQLINHMIKDENLGIVGGLYYHRGGEFRPVLMKKSQSQDGAYVFLNDSELERGLQEVDVQGGGCMLIRLSVMDKIQPPYFEPELQTGKPSYGTDVQLCRKFQEAGYKVACDTSIEIGHVMEQRTIVTRTNRGVLLSLEAAKKGVSQGFILDEIYQKYKADALEYMGIDEEELLSRAYSYKSDEMSEEFREAKDKVKYYQNLGKSQLCRHVWYNGRPNKVADMLSTLARFMNAQKALKGLDFGCGSSPIGFQLAKRGMEMDFVDIPGTYSFEFLMWRCEKYGIPEERINFKLGGPYDFVFMYDVIEHLEYDKWKAELDNVLGRIKEEGVLLTNYFGIRDFTNPEHINMNHDQVGKFLASRKFFPMSDEVWVKKDNYLAGPMQKYN